MTDPEKNAINEHAIITMMMASVGYNLNKPYWPSIERRLELLEMIVDDYREEIKLQSD